MPQLPISDEYFNRSAAVVADMPLYRKRVRYAVFAREEGMVCGIQRAVAFIEQHYVGPLLIRARSDGETFRSMEAILILEGLFGELVNLETTYLGMLAFSGATNTRIVVTSGFTAEKVAAFRACGAPMDFIGTGSWVNFFVFTSDITDIFEGGTWIPCCKAGRNTEIVRPNLPIRIQKT